MMYLLKERQKLPMTINLKTIYKCLLLPRN